MATAALSKPTEVAALEAWLREMAKIQKEVKPLTERFKELQGQAFPLVEAAGDHYEVDGITAEIQRPTTLEVDAVKLLRKFGKKAYGLLTVSVKKYRAAVESGQFGSARERRGIAKQVDQAPRFVLSQR